MVISDEDGNQKVHIEKNGDEGNKEMQVCVYKSDDGKQVIETKVIMLKLSDADEKKLEDSGVAATEEKNELNVEELNFFPNPNSGMFNLNFKLEKRGDTQIQIFDMNGKQVYMETLRNFSGEYNKDIDISEQGKGTYFLNITQGDKVLNKKILIQ